VNEPGAGHGHRAKIHAGIPQEDRECDQVVAVEVGVEEDRARRP
jgi:hypothetical protein